MIEQQDLSSKLPPQTPPVVTEPPINTLATSLTIGLFFAISLFVLVIVANIFLEGLPLSLSAGSIQIVYKATILNTVISSACAFIIGLFSGFAGGYIFARFYNYLRDLLNGEPSQEG